MNAYNYIWNLEIHRLECRNNQYICILEFYTLFYLLYLIKNHGFCNNDRKNTLKLLLLFYMLNFLGYTKLNTVDSMKVAHNFFCIIETLFQTLVLLHYLQQDYSIRYIHQYVFHFLQFLNFYPITSSSLWIFCKLNL